ncbi:hypothetical protein H6P81_001453 [Aristolochia fimbriata]|uniref:GST N-terminal domain-containing protein n=1 Tax=Aristolochia fimbriata TaxID=158543 RepID=A0AAV7F6X4_ARIFI|nr:hypothetical protein H6P81_001453 [Aristolochia fimbriata]
MLSPTHSILRQNSSESSVVNFRFAGLGASCSNSVSSSGTSRLGRTGKWSPCKFRFRAKMAKSEKDVERITGVPANGASPSSSFLSFLCPLLKLFGEGDPSRERNDVLEIVTSSLSSLARLPWGSKSLVERPRTQFAEENYTTYLQLYEFEACPFCRRVREAMTELDLSVEVYPCPKGSLRHREIVRDIGGKEQFPFLVDPKTGRSLYESGDIVKYLFNQYGQGKQPSIGLLESTIFTGWVPTILRAGRGMSLWPRAKLEPPMQKLELFSYENNMYARIVREALCELEIPYILRNVGEGSTNSELLLRTSGSNEVPYLVDPNTSTKLGKHKNILSYLFQTYSIVN